MVLLQSLRNPEGLEGQKVLKAREVWKGRGDWKVQEGCGVQEFHKALKVNKSNEFYKVHKVLVFRELI